MLWPALLMIPITIPCSFPICQVLTAENVHPFMWRFEILGGGFQSSTNAVDQNSEMQRSFLVILLLPCQKSIGNMSETMLNMRYQDTIKYADQWTEHVFSIYTYNMIYDTCYMCKYIRYTVIHTFYMHT